MRAGDAVMISLAHLKARLGQYAALWVAAFLLSGAAILGAVTVMDLMAAADLVLPVLLAVVALAAAAGVMATLLSGRSLGTKLAVTVLAVLLLLPLLWAPVSAAVLIAFFADRSIEYSSAYAAFQIGVGRVLFPLSEAFGGGELFGWVWSAFQWVSSLVGAIAAWMRIWPLLRRLLGPEPAREA